MIAQGTNCPFTFIVKMSEKMTIIIKVQIAKKVSKINLRIISKPHAHLQSIVKTSVKFQKNQNKTRRSCLHKVHTPIGGRKDGRNDGKPKAMSLCFSSKRRGTKKMLILRKPTLDSFVYFSRKHYLCISAPAMPLPDTPPSPGPGSYEMVDYEGAPRHYMSGAAFVSTTSRWNSSALKNADLPGPG